MTDASLAPVSIRKVGTVSVVTIDNPPVNALSNRVRVGLLHAISAIEADQNATAIVLTGAGDIFVAGADIREFDGSPAVPSISQVVEAIDRCPKPVVAIIKGNTLGGGLELALAADHRLIEPQSKLAFPEVRIGIIPGAGGTQRLPRLIGIGQSLDLITSGRTINAAEAIDLGIGQAPSGSDSLSAAIDVANQLRSKRRISECSIMNEEREDDPYGTEKPSPEFVAAIACIRAAATMSFRAGLHYEAQRFGALKTSTRARALRYLFFAERKSAKLDPFIKARPVRTIAIVGAGTMGAGIAVATAAAGFRTLLLDRDDAALAAGRDRVSGILAKLARKRPADGTITATVAENLRFQQDWHGMEAADLIIEAVFEDLALKKSILNRCAAIARPEAILASNTSYLDLNALASDCGRAADVIGLHFFNPAYTMPLLEIVRGQSTSRQAVATALSVGKRLGKQCVIAGVGEGFIANRLFSAYRRHCELLVAHGVSPYDIDDGLERFGFAMGPFATSDLAGLDIAWATRKRLAQAAGANQVGSSIADKLCERGHFGRKTGRGWYLYDGGRRKPDPDVLKIIAENPAAAAIDPRACSSVSIEDQVMAILANEGCHILAEGIAQRASDIDVTFVNGFRFPRGLGGPIFHADVIGLGKTHAIISTLGAGLNPTLVVAPALASCEKRQQRLSDLEPTASASSEFASGV